MCIQEGVGDGCTEMFAGCKCTPERMSGVGQTTDAAR